MGSKSRPLYLLPPNSRRFQVAIRAEYLGLEFEPACLRFYENARAVRTASSEQVRKPIYADSVGRWKRYEKQLDELLEVLKPVLPRYERVSGS